MFPEHAAFALALLALIRLDTPESHAVLTPVAAHPPNDAISAAKTEVAFATDAARVQAGHGIYARHAEIPCFTALLDGFRNCWLGTNSRVNRRLARTARCLPKPSRNQWLQVGRGRVRQRPAEAKSSCAAKISWDFPTPRPLLEELGTRTLAVLEEPLPPWERSLKALEQLAYDTTNKGRENSPTSAPVEKRLVWDVHRYYDNVNVTPTRAAPQQERHLEQGAPGRPKALGRGCPVHGPPPRKRTWLPPPRS